MIYCAALWAQLELAQGDLPADYHWAASSGLSTDDVPCYPHEQAYLTLARVRIAEERVSPTGDGLSDVLFLLEHLLAKAEVSKRWHSVLEILLPLALAWEDQGVRTAVLTTLGRALMLTEPEGYARLFLDEGPALLALLRQAAGATRRCMALDGGRLHPFPRQKSPRNYSFWVLSSLLLVSYTLSEIPA